MKWHIARTEVSKSFRLSNGKYLKVLFSLSHDRTMWFVSIAVAKSIRKCNDCFRKPEHSPKVLYGKRTGGNLGMEPFMMALQCLLEFEKAVHGVEIEVNPARPALEKIYSRLLRYGYKDRTIKFQNGCEKVAFYKPV